MPILLNATIGDLSQALDSRAITAVELTKAYLARINEVNNYFHAVLETNPDAISIAAALDEEQATTGRRGPLHGIPILLKDSIITLDKMEATAGSTVLLGAKPAREARLVSKLRDSGAVILGKTNLSEWGNFRAVEGGCGWSARGGVCHGAYYPHMRSGGSSSGSAVATALGLAAACIGGETDGSINTPSSRNGVVGLKPTTGLISGEGVIPIAVKMDTAGPITRSVHDAAILLDALAESSSEPNSYSAYLQSAAPDLTGLRIGVPIASLENLENMGASDMVQAEVFREAMNVLESAGATIVVGAVYHGAEEFARLEVDERLSIMAGELQGDIRTYLATLATNPLGLKTLDDIIIATKEDPRECYPERGIGLFELAQHIDLNSEEYKHLSERNAYFAGEGGIPGTLAKHNLDAIAAFSVGGQTITMAARAGLPTISVPMGVYPQNQEVQHEISGPDNLVYYAPGIPFGITFTGAARSEKTLLKIALTFEGRAKVKSKLEVYSPPETDLLN